jgi:hypothetical protein
MLGNAKKNIGYDGSSYSSNQSGLSNQALAWQSAILSAGGTISNSVLTIIDNNLIKPMVSSGILNHLRMPINTSRKYMFLTWMRSWG